MLKQTALDTTLEQFGLQSTGNLKQNLLMILKSDKIDTIFDYMKDAKILEHILPEFIPCIGLDQRTPHHCYTVDKHILAVVKNINANPKLVGYDKDILLISALLHDIGKPEALDYNLVKKGLYKFTNHADFSAKITPSILKRFGYKHKEIKTIRQIVKHHEFFRYIKLYNTPEKGNRMTTSYIFKTIDQVGAKNFELLLEHYYADFMGQSTFNRDYKRLILKCSRQMFNYYLTTHKKVYY